jgi:hypothetical protein
MPIPGLGELVERGLTRMGGEAFGETFGKTARSLEHHTFNQTDVGKYTQKLLTNYKMGVDQNTAALAKGVTGLSSAELRSHAAGFTRTQVFGQDDKALVKLMAHSHATHGYYYTQNLMDSTAMILREDNLVKGNKHVSEFKSAAVEQLKKAPEFKRDPTTGLRPIDPKTGKPATYQYNVTSDYVKPGEVEKWVSNFVVGRIAPMIVLPHIGTGLNVVWGTRTAAWSKALGQMVSGQSPAQLKQTLIAAGITAESTMRSMRSSEAIRRGLVTRFLPGSIQDVMAKISSTPLFGNLRDFQIHWAGASSFHDVQDYAEMFAKDPNDGHVKRRLGQYGLTPHDLSAIGKTGKLTPEQLTKAVWHGVNRKVFLDTSFARSYHAQRNGLNRSVTMFHGYVSRQALFMGEEFRTTFEKESRSPLGMAKAMVVAGALFPAVGEGIKMLEMVGRGQWAEISNDLQDDYESLTFQKGNSKAAKVGHFIETYAEAYATLGAFGIMYNLFMGAHRGALAMHMVGPAIGRSFQYVQDIDRAVENMNTNHKLRSATPALRDLLEIVGGYGTGHFASHMLLPSASEKKRAKKRKDADEFSVKAPKEESSDDDFVIKKTNKELF